MVYALALAAALVSASAGITQRLGLETAPLGSAMRLRLLTYALRRGIWLFGFALLLAQFVLQAMALRFGQLSVVQPVLTMDLLFVVTILAVLFHRPIGWREWTGAGAIVAGLAGFLVIAHPATGKGNVGTHLWGIVTVSTFLAATALVLGAQRGARWWRAAAFGAASAILFAYNAALTKATTDLITHGWSHVFIHWEPYGIAVTGLAGFFLLQNALHAGPIAASRATLVTCNPLASIAIGAAVFGEHLRSGGVPITAEILALLLLSSGAVLLAHSPLVSTGDPNGPHSEFLRTPVERPA